ncbi:lipid II flippase MurJ, partial [Escherichia coli]|uniref:lipid II flippase MurJ n=1 Tax=Escherichia coli TaxID=562 RepID=UPI003F52CEF2
VKQCWSKRRNREAVPRIQNRSHQRRQGDQKDIGKGNLLKITFPYIFLISLASLVGAILNTWNRFSIPAFAPTLLNISMI